MLVLIKGAGDIATGIGARLHRCGFSVVHTELANPSSIRRTVCFSEAVRLGETQVEDMVARRAETAQEVQSILQVGEIPVVCDEKATMIEILKPDIVVDAILAKVNTGTKITDAPLVIGIGPGFTAGEDCHAVVETKRGHYLGRVIWQGSAIPNTGIPGIINGYGIERVMHSPCGGTFKALAQIGDSVEEGQIVATIGGEPLKAKIPGILRGLLPDGFEVPRAGFKSADVDPRGDRAHCFSVSDKAQAVAGGVMEAILCKKTS